MNTPLNAEIQQILDALTSSGAETGLQVAVYVDGALVVDAWAGVADPATGSRVDGDTLFTSWSTTKGFVATCLHILADRGRVDYDAPIAAYWPEFAANGKAGVTVRHALAHTAGVPQMPADVTPEMMLDWDAMCAAIAGHAPLWAPGSMLAYHAWTYGWIIGEIVRRVDGRGIAQFAREELCQPLGIQDFYLGIPDSVEPRVAPIRQDARSLEEARNFSEMQRRTMPPQVTNTEFMNRPAVRRAVLPGGGGIMSARAIARHYAMLAGGGVLDGVRVLSPGRVEEMRALQTDAVDVISGARSRRALGYGLGGDPAQGGSIEQGGPESFGHGGYGGSSGFADPLRKIGFGLTKNLMTAGEPAQAVVYRVAELVRRFVDGS